MALSKVSAVDRRAPAFPEFVALMASLMAMTALSIDIMLPALPRIRDDFGLSDRNAQQLVVTFYVLGFGAGQLVYGPLSDRFGRKSVLGAGLGLYALASFLCMVAGTFEVLLAARLLQGIANAAPRVIAIAVVRDLYGGRRMAEVMSFVMMIFIIVPAVAPAIGSGILLVGDWHVIFGLLGAISIAVLTWAALRLPETRPPELRDKLSLTWLLGAVRETLTTRQTLGYTLAIGAVFGGLMSYINSAQQVFVVTYGVGAWFPLVFAIVAAALAAAAILNSRFVARVGMRPIGHGAMCGYFAAALLHVGLELLLGRLPLAAFLALISAQLFCFGFIMPNYNSLAMEPMGRIAGTASSFVGAVTTGLAAIFGWVVGQSYDGTAWPLTLGFVAFGAAGLATTYVTERGRLFRAIERGDAADGIQRERRP